MSVGISSLPSLFFSTELDFEESEILFTYAHFIVYSVVLKWYWLSVGVYIHENPIFISECKVNCNGAIIKPWNLSSCQSFKYTAFFSGLGVLPWLGLCPALLKDENRPIELRVLLRKRVLSWRTRNKVMNGDNINFFALSIGIHKNCHPCLISTFLLKV